ncbi:MAG: phosphoglycerate kinase [Parcubacteria group bacterium]|nr:phosphoglycerate kinase [Parcubacteria group bacterium]
MPKNLKELSKEELNNKKIFLRVDFNIPVEDGEIKEKYRIKVHKETIDFLVLAGARVALVSHISGGFRTIAGEIGKILGHEIAFEEDILNSELESQITLFENIRRYEGEEENDENFARELASSFDVYINDAFSVSHRNHASVSAITGFLPSYAGFLMEKEIDNLEKVLNAPAQEKTVILGGAKISTKLPVIKNFINKAEHILIAGALANAVFKFKGLNIGRSIAEDSKVSEALKETDWDDSRILLPKDIVVSEDRTGRSTSEVLPLQNLKDDQYILDIGPETAKLFSEIVKKSKIVIFNGPLGLAEVESFSAGTKIVFDSIIRSGAFSVVGGGDTLALVEKLELLNKFSYVSTGGGAMLEFLAGNKLPGLEALGYYL